MEKTKNAVVYARYSSHKQGEQSIEGQLAAAYKYAQNNGYKIIHEYVDRAQTGRNDNREQFQEMLKDCAKKQFGTIILWKIDRFGRNREEIAFNKYRAKKCGVKVVYVAESIPDSPEGVILESVLEGMAEYYSLQLSQNTTRGLKASAEKCQSTGGTRPLGYNVDPETKRFVIDPKTAPTVQLVFERYAAGATITEIITELNQKGLRTARGAKFTKSSLRTMLKSEKYIGVYVYNNTVRIEGGMPAIVSPELFDKVQQMLVTNKRAPVHTWNCMEYLLTDKLFCGKCGEKMIGESGTGKSGRKYNYYACAGHKRRQGCDKKAVHQAWIEGLVLDAIVELLSDEENLENIATAVWEYYCTNNDKIALEESLRGKLTEIEKAIGNIIKAIEAGAISDATIKRMNELEEQRAEIETELAGLELSKAINVSKEYVLFYLHELRNGDAENREFQKRLIDTFVNSIYLFDDNVKIAFNYSGDNATITLNDFAALDADAGEVAGCSDIARRGSPQRTRPNTIISKIVVFRNVFICTINVTEQ